MEFEVMCVWESNTRKCAELQNALANNTSYYCSFGHFPFMKHLRHCAAIEDPEEKD